MNGIWQRHRTEHPKSKYLPLIYPLIFYNGTKKYSAPRSFFDLFQDPERAKNFLLNPVNVINVHEIPDEKFKEYPHAGVVEFFLKKHQERNMLKLLEEVQAIWERLDSISITQKESLISIILWYNIDKIETSNDKYKIIDFVNKNLEVEGDRFMASIARQWEKEGFQKGMQQGVIQGMQQGIEQGAYQRSIEIARAMLKSNQDISFISEITGLSMNEIIRLKS